MNQETNESAAPDKMDVYRREATAHSKNAIFWWCLVGWIYASVTWYVFWLPGVLIFLPGIFVASLIAMIFFIPLWFVKKRLRSYGYGRGSLGLLILGTVLKIALFCGPIAGSIGYVHLLRYFMDSKR